ncbi:carbamate kinase [Actinomyces ruminicola]|uniref:Carbamate kinase n=1 Tax=Actinomyces ruminicola TaxID=332524 RepID=A0A1G9W7F7_9ACTO|nr:carbamate kinase [Actinomyces ruminicola]SDM80462.1 carbamate kinase [Actinomyces ruminicola]
MITGTRDPRLVIALGGNALGDSPDEQLERLRVAAPEVIDLIEQGYEIVISHGNGPQVGLINTVFARAAAAGVAPAGFDLATSTAMSQGYIGYHIQQALECELRARGMPWHVATVVTQVVTDPDDPAYDHPTKPVGPFVSQEAAERMMAVDPDLVMVEDSGRGWRQVVASPQPRSIVEVESLLNLLDHEFIVVACGGGGIPVVMQPDGAYAGTSAVIDKDLTSSLLAQSVDASVLVILTAVSRVALNFGRPDQVELAEMSLEELDRYVEQGQFATGSMLPKVLAARAFVASGPGRTAIICDLMEAAGALRGTTGTVIHP